MKITKRQLRKIIRETINEYGGRSGPESATDSNGLTVSVGDKVRITKDQTSRKTKHLKAGNTGTITELGWEVVNPGINPLHPDSHPPRILWAYLALDVEPADPPFGYGQYSNSVSTYDLELI